MSSYRRHHHQIARGQILLAMALAMGLFLSGLFALVIDLSVLYTQSTRVQSAAQSGAQAGANDIEAGSLYFPTGPTGREPKLRSTWKTTCSNVAKRSAEGGGTFVRVTPSNPTTISPYCRLVNPGDNKVAVTIRKRIKLPVSIFPINANVEETAYAIPVRGGRLPYRVG